mmetsp:Transcript_21736/g.36999  ORF Transcript_21736/g.36999 Transcript_21736/m.36999 type:complete len:90 (-) Transcript_21736:29-298(-)
MWASVLAAQSSSKLDVAAGGAWQRRTPHATNVLRAQLEMAESRQDTALSDRRNIPKLMENGNQQLLSDLERNHEKKQKRTNPLAYPRLL